MQVPRIAMCLDDFNYHMLLSSWFPFDSWHRKRFHLCKTRPLEWGRDPQVVVDSEGAPVLKDREEEHKYDPTMWLLMLRVRICAPKGLTDQLCEAQYSILYFCFTKNLIERPDMEFTDTVRGLKIPALLARKLI